MVYRIIAVFCIGLPAVLAGTHSVVAAHPNIVYILADDMGYGVLTGRYPMRTAIKSMVLSGYAPFLIEPNGTDRHVAGQPDYISRQKLKAGRFGLYPGRCDQSEGEDRLRTVRKTARIAPDAS